MTLAATFIEAEHAAGKTTAKLLADLRAATGYTAADHSTLFRWKNGERNPRPEVRKYMLKKALPYLLLQGRDPDTDARIAELQEGRGWAALADRLL